MDDISPKYITITAEQEIVIPPLFGDTPTQTVGGFKADAQQLTQGKITIQGVAQRILIGDATLPLTGIGIFMGYDGAATAGYDFRVGDPSGSYMHWDASAATLTIVGTITATAGTIGGFNIGADYIRDAANSFGMASTVTGGDDVRFWAGDTFANRATAPFRVTEAGAAHFENVVIGGTTIQYVITNSGIFSYGDGSDGAATFDGSSTPAGSSKSGSDYTLTRDVYYTNATLSTGVTLNPAGYRIFGTGVLTLNGTAIIKRNGNAGGAGGTPAAGRVSSGDIRGTPGAALADGYLKGSVAGSYGAGDLNSGCGQGADTSNNAVNGAVGSVGTNTTNSIGSNGSAGSSGGNGGNYVTSIGVNKSNSTSGAGATGGTATASNVKLIANWHLATLLDVSASGSTVKFDNSASGGGGGAGGGGGCSSSGGSNGSGGTGGGGGGSGSSGGIVAIYFRSIIIGASAAIQANGGNGGAGGNGSAGLASSGNISAGGGGGGGGGAGGNGGQIILVYNVLSNSGSITVNGGTGGAGGSGGVGAAIGGGNSPGATGSSGTAGNNGSVGTIRQFQLSL